MRSSSEWVGSIVLAFFLVGTISGGAVAGTVSDTDGDGVPDVFDNCRLVPNGPNDLLNQTNTDDDRYGDACDCDYNQSGLVLGDDFLELFGAFNTDSVLHDNTGDGIVLGNDILVCFGQTSSGPGPGSSALR